MFVALISHKRQNSVPDNGFCQRFLEVKWNKYILEWNSRLCGEKLPTCTNLIASYRLHCWIKNIHSICPHIWRRTGHTFSQAFTTELNSCHCSEIFFRDNLCCCNLRQFLLTPIFHIHPLNNSQVWTWTSQSCYIGKNTSDLEYDSVCVAGGRNSTWVSEVDYYLIYSRHLWALFARQAQLKNFCCYLGYIIWNVETPWKISIQYWNRSQKLMLLEKQFSFVCSTVWTFNLEIFVILLA